MSTLFLNYFVGIFPNGAYAPFLFQAVDIVFLNQTICSKNAVFALNC